MHDGRDLGTGVLNVLAQQPLGNQIKIVIAVRDSIGTDIVFSGWQLVGWCTPHVTARDKPGQSLVCYRIDRVLKYTQRVEPLQNRVRKLHIVSQCVLDESYRPPIGLAAAATK